MSRELVWTGFISLDGVMDSPGATSEGHRSGGWVAETEFVPEAFSLKEGDGGGIFIHGSGELAQRLGEADLIDRYNLLVFPVVLGSGKELFPRVDRKRQNLSLRKSAAYPQRGHLVGV